MCVVFEQKSFFRQFIPAGFCGLFARRKQATEEMIMVLEQDGLWRVAGYHIQ